MEIIRFLRLLSDSESFSRFGDTLSRVIDEVLNRMQLEDDLTDEELDDATLARLSAARKPHGVITVEPSKASR